MVQLLPEDLSLRQIAARLKISLSTAFHWRHRALAALSRQPRQSLGGGVCVCMFHVKYSEKGSRVCNGPGSWGYWNFVRRGPEPEGRPRPQGAKVGRRRFRLLIDGRPVGVMAAQNDRGYELFIVGQGRITPEFVSKGLAQLVEPGSHVFAFGSHEYKKACESLGLVHHNGRAIAGGWSAQYDAQAAVLWTGDPGAARVRCPALPGMWLRRFKGVATRYLAHYLAWFRDIIHYGGSAKGVALARAPALSLLRASRLPGTLPCTAG